MKAPEAFRTISEVATELDLPQHVLRFWETRFPQIKPMKRGGGRRYYRPEDVDLLRGIRLLLYGQGFTIRGVQRLLKEKGVAFVAQAGQSGSVQTVTVGDPEEKPPRRRRGAPAAMPAGREEDEDTVSDEAELPAEPISAERVEPRPLASPPVAAPPSPPQPPRVVLSLGRENRRKLEATISELLEARRLLEGAH